MCVVMSLGVCGKLGADVSRDAERVQVEELEKKVNGYKAEAERHSAEAEQSREKYNKLFKAVEEQQTAKSKPKIDTSKKADELSIAYYKDMVKEKDRELAKLLSRNRQMSRVETSGKLMAKRFEDQRTEMSARMGQVCAVCSATDASLWCAI